MPDTAPVPPQSLEAEDYVLGAMLLAEGAIGAVTDVVGRADFYRESNALVYDAILDLYRKGEPADVVTVIDQLDERGTLDRAGGRGRVHELAALVPATANAAHYARIVKDHATLRGLIRVGGDVARLGWERPADVAELLDEAERLIFGLAQENLRHDLEPVRGALRDAFERMVALSKSGSDVIGVASGFPSLDRVTLGFQPGNLIVLAARPSMGKSALALNVAANVAVRGSALPAALFTLEMSRQEVTQRLLASEANVPLRKVVSGRSTPDEWSRLATAGNRIDPAPLYVDDASATSVVEIRSKARRWKAQHPDAALVVVDYLGLLVRGRPSEKVAETGEACRALKVLAGDLELPVLLCCQLSRNVEYRGDKRPVLADLRDSGEIEQHADLVGFLYRDDYYNPETSDTPGVAELHVAKHRNGPTDTVKLSWRNEYAKFTELAFDR